MQIGQTYNYSGFVTQEKYLLGQSLQEIETRLGYKKGRLAEGIWVGRLLTLPITSQFDLKGYSMVAGHRDISLEGLDINVLKKNALGAMKTEGIDRLIKVFPVIGHNNNINLDEQYPPGSGVPQWNLNTPLPFLIISFIEGYPVSVYSR